MKQDIFGQQVTLETDPGLRDWNATQLAFLSHSAQTADLLAAVLRAEPGFALGLAVKGLFCLLQGRCELNVTAAEALRAARAAAAKATSPRASPAIWRRWRPGWLANPPWRSPRWRRCWTAIPAIRWR